MPAVLSCLLPKLVSLGFVCYLLAGEFESVDQLAELQTMQAESKEKLQGWYESQAASLQPKPKGGKTKQQAQKKAEKQEKAPKAPEVPLVVYRDTKGELVAETVFRCVFCFAWIPCKNMLGAAVAVARRSCRLISSNGRGSSSRHSTNCTACNRLSCNKGSWRTAVVAAASRAG
jgi:hypothetical protein